MSEYPMPPNWVLESLRAGQVIPAHPLALTQARRLDERRQRALTRYYHGAGAGGIAVGVHTTQFAIRDPRVGLFEPVLRLALETMLEWERQNGKRLVKVAGVCGPAHATSDRQRRRSGPDAGVVGDRRDSGSPGDSHSPALPACERARPARR